MKNTFAAFVDVSPEETLQASPFENFKDSTQTDSSKDSQSTNQVRILIIRFFAQVVVYDFIFLSML